MRLLLPCLLLLCAACSDGGSGDDPQPKPDTDDFVFCSDRTGNFELYRRRFGELVQLTDDPLYDSWWPRTSPDGARLVFYRSLVADRPPSGGANNNYARRGGRDGARAPDGGRRLRRQRHRPAGGLKEPQRTM